MKYFKCENCGSELTKNADNTYTCDYCRRTYYDDSLEKAYDRVYKNLRATVQGVVAEELVREKIEKIATCRRALYKERNEQFVDNDEIARWANEILLLSPKDAQANFYALAAKKRWGELNKFMQKLNAREVGYLVEGFVDYLTNGRFVKECVLCLVDLIDGAFDAGSKEYAACHKKIVAADERDRSGIFDVSLPRDVFVAYSSKDKEEAYELVEHLERNGFSCFIAARNLAKGVDAALEYNERLKTAMDSCRVFLLVSSTNSRARDCDAYRIEMQYIRECDCKKADDSTLANARYAEYLNKNRRRCKPRVEYLIGDYGSSPYEKIVKQFFDGLTWCRNLEEVVNAVFDLIENTDVQETDELSGKAKAEIEAENARNERAKLQAELENARLQIELERAKREAEEVKKLLEKSDKPADSPLSDFVIEDGFLRKYAGRDENVVIPSVVTAIGSKAFQNHKELVSVVVPDTVTWIGDESFHQCDNLKSVALPNSATSIGIRCFAECGNLEKINLPASLETIGDVAFWRCKELKAVDIPETVTKIGRSAFCDCVSLTNIKIPDSVTDLGDGAFRDCTSLANVLLGDGLQTIWSYTFAGCKKLTKVEIPIGVNTIKAGAFDGCDKLTVYTERSGSPTSWESGWIPFNAKVHWNYVSKEILEKRQKLKNELRKERELARKNGFDVSEHRVLQKYFGTDSTVVVPDCVEELSYNAFDSADIRVVKIGKNVKIGHWSGSTFSSTCRNLERIDVDPANASFESVDGVFYSKEGYEELQLMKYPSGKTDETFFVPESATTIGAESFRGCDNLRKVVLHNGVQKIEKEAFGYCENLTEVVLGKGLTSIGDRAFYGCSSLEKIIVPASVVEIGAKAFEGCGNAVILVEAKDVPDRWSGDWNPDYLKVKWGYDPQAQARKEAEKSAEKARGGGIFKWFKR